MRRDRDLIEALAWGVIAMFGVGLAMVYIGRRFEWARPEWRWSLLLLPVLLAGHLWWRNARRPTVRISTWQAFLHAPQGMLTRLRHVPFALSMAGLGMMLLAMARPQSRDAWQDVETEGIDIVIAMDISASMLAKDFKPDRLSASKAVAMKFIDERPNDRIGLVVYEGEAFTQCPLTTDHDVLKDLFAKTRSGLIQGGTAVGMGLATAVNRLRESTAKSKVVILLTDGVNNAGTVQPLDAAQIAKQMGVRVYTIGVGTRGKAMSPVAIYPNGQYKFDMVDVEIDEDMLRQVADITGGKYFRATNEHKLTDIYDEIDKLEKTRIKVTEHSRRNEEYFPFLLAGGCLLLLAFSVDNGLLRLTPMNQRISRTGPVVLASILVEFVLWAVMLTILFFVLHQVPAFRFERPKVLWAMCAGPVVLFLFLLDLRRRWRALQRFAGTAMLPRMVPGVVFGNSFLRYLFFRLGLLFLVIALAGPQFGTRIEEVKAKGVDVMVCLDVSNSMLCEDLRPDRLELAQRALAQLIDHIHGDRLGIVVFAGDAFVQLPITADRSAAKLFLASVGTDLVPTQGTAIGAAIDLAARSFDKDSPTSKAIIVITDGENHEDDAEGAARHAMEQGIVVHTIGMGTVQGGPIPCSSRRTIVRFQKDKDGNTVVSSLDEGMLQRIAAAGKGAFVRATQTSTGINELVDELRKMDQTEIGTYRFAGHEDKYALPLAIAIGLFILSLLVPERGRSGHIKIPHTA